MSMKKAQSHTLSSFSGETAATLEKNTKNKVEYDTYHARLSKFNLVMVEGHHSSDLIDAN